MTERREQATKVVKITHKYMPELTKFKVSDKDLKYIWNLVHSVESHTQQVYQEALELTDGLKECMENSPNKPPFSINYLEYYNSYEPVTSWIIRHFFAYKYNGHHPFFESFAKTFLQGIGFRLDWINEPIIDKDHEYKSIDILVRDKQYAVIIENKLKGAEFQLNQLARYITTMRDEGYSNEQIFVVILPKDDINNEDLYESVWKLPKDWQSTTSTRKCRVNDHTCWCDYDGYTPKAHCRKCQSLMLLYENRTLFVHKELSEWLYDCVANNGVGLQETERTKQYVLQSAALQFVDFLNSLYKTRENDKYKMDMQKFLSEQLKLKDLDIPEQLSVLADKMNDVQKLYDEIEFMYRAKMEEYPIELGRKHKIHINYKEEDKNYFYCELTIGDKLLKLSVDFDDDGTFCQLEMVKRGRLPEVVKNDYEISEELDTWEDNSNIWKYDTYEESVLRFGRVLDRLFEIQKDC